MAQTTVDLRRTAADSVVESLFQSIRTLKAAGAPGNSVDGACSAVLHYVQAHGPVRPTDLAAQMMLDGSTVSRHLQTLERLDLVDRERDPEDGRAFRIACTPAGSSAAAAALAARRDLLLTALEGWSAPDLVRLQELLGRLTRDLASACPHTRTSGRDIAAADRREDSQ